MENKICCEKCKESFEDGEIMGYVDYKTYHCIFESAEKFSGCADTVPQAGIYYQGKIYSIFDMAKLKNLKEIKSKRTRKGFGFSGDLENLLSCKEVLE
jgi:hypothetical protein